MKKKSIYFVLLFTLCIHLFIGCTNKPINFTKNQGTLVKAQSNVITIKHKRKFNKGFYVYIDFQLKEGRVDWELLDPKGNTAFKGYVSKENEKMYKELTYPSNYLDNSMNKKEEVKDIATFKPLIFNNSNEGDEYSFILNPIDAEGIYTIQWSDRLETK